VDNAVAQRAQSLFSLLTRRSPRNGERLRALLVEQCRGAFGAGNPHREEQGSVGASHNRGQRSNRFDLALCEREDLSATAER